MIPQSVKAVLWSYDTSKIDLQRDKKVIIANILNLGTMDAINWLFNNYDKNEITKVADEIPVSAWSKKSLALWKLVLKINPPAQRIIK